MKALLIFVVFSLLLASSALGAVHAVRSLGGVQQTLALWRSHVGNGRRLSGDRQRRLNLVARVAVRPTKTTVLRETAIGGRAGPAIYLDLVSRNPVWALRHARTLIRVVSSPPYVGGWAIRLRNERNVTVWIAGHAGNQGFVGSATKAIDAASPVTHP